jgi:hypothetical protein
MRRLTKGFNYDINALKGEKNELSDAFNTLFSLSPRISVFMFLRLILGKFAFLVVSFHLPSSLLVLIKFTLAW